jgi:YHS domain-containing protein
MGQKLPAMILVLAFFAPDAPPRRAADQAALKPFAGLVGEWKGTGLPRRGSSRGAWTESAGWAWKLSNDSAALRFSSEKGKYLKAAVLKPGTAPGTFLLEATLADGASRSFSGKPNARNTLVLTPEAPVEQGLARITLTPLHDTRFLMLLEAGEAGGGLARLGEVGFTRQGVAFAAGDSAPACIVTEGRGTIPVMHKGRTYYVCCSGCKDLFHDDPEAVLAEAERRKADKAK